MGAIPRELEVVVRDRFWRRCSGVVVQLCMEFGEPQLAVTGRSGTVTFLVPDVARVAIVVDGVRQEFIARDEQGHVRQIAITR